MCLYKIQKINIDCNLCFITPFNIYTFAHFIFRLLEYKDIMIYF